MTEYRSHGGEMALESIAHIPSSHREGEETPKLVKPVRPLASQPASQIDAIPSPNFRGRNAQVSEYSPSNRMLELSHTRFYMRLRYAEDCKCCLSYASCLHPSDKDDAIWLVFMLCFCCQSMAIRSGNTGQKTAVESKTYSAAPFST